MVVLPPPGEPAEYDQNYVLFWNDVGLDLNGLDASLRGPQGGPALGSRALATLQLTRQWRTDRTGRDYSEVQGQLRVQVMHASLIPLLHPGPRRSLGRSFLKAVLAMPPQKQHRGQRGERRACPLTTPAHWLMVKAME